MADIRHDAPLNASLLGENVQALDNLSAVRNLFRELEFQRQLLLQQVGVFFRIIIVFFLDFGFSNGENRFHARESVSCIVVI